ncbi:ComEC/Rec2 family competence protein [Pelagibacterium xiamenense]|uniref:ComEC/Rec2 family competence protein n=1 Tax=Pelagibacterium xiamenense TaxID=2901140 RepID=UPI001E48E793|nr:ComEC/Rec2 family competence protein [Pelagibacterium xiamenense]MCD7060934.1 ComEC family competence protein [Pelagibacterium xiamenense]
MIDGAVTGGNGQGTRPTLRRAGLLGLAGAARLQEEIAHAVSERRLFVILPCAVILGMLLYRALPGEPHGSTLGAGAVLLAVLAYLNRTRYVATRFLVLVGAVYAGLVILPIHSALFGTPMLDGPRYGVYRAQVDAVVYDNGEVQRLVISRIRPDDARDDPGVRRARVTVFDSTDIAPGDMLSARIRFYPVPGPIVPGGYDSQFVSYFEGIGAYGAVQGEIEITPGSSRDVVRLSSGVRSFIAQRVLAALDDRIGGIAVALITGDQSRISEQDRNLMAAAGLAHVLAISGLHLTIVAGTMFAFIRLGLAAFYGVAQRVPIKRTAAAGALVTACAYLVISGMGISAIRATIMLSLVFAAILAGRQALTMRNVAIAALIIIAIAPASVFRASFQLSFAAVVALIAAYELARTRRERQLEPRHPIATFVIDIAMTSIIAGLATVLFSAYHFQQTAPFGLMGNLLAMPIVSFIMMPSALFATLAIPLGLDGPLYQIMGWSIEAVIWCAGLVHAIGGGFDPSPILSPLALVFALFGLAWLAFFQTPIRLFGPALVMPLVLLFGLERAPDILIADTSQAIAVRHDSQLALVAGRTNTFATDVWSERYMEPIGSNHETTNCDEIGCVIASDLDFTLAYVTNVAAFSDDCRIADVVVARISAPQSCAARATVVDQRALERSGAHMLYWDIGAHRFVVKPAVVDPDRPWRVGAQ